MAHFSDQDLLTLIGAFALRVVAGDFRGADDLAGRVADRRYGERNRNKGTVLAAPDCFKVFDALAATDAFQQARFLVDMVGRNEDRDGLADRFARRITENSLDRKSVV